MGQISWVRPLKKPKQIYFFRVSIGLLSKAGRPEGGHDPWCWWRPWMMIFVGHCRGIVAWQCLTSWLTPVWQCWHVQWWTLGPVYLYNLYHLVMTNSSPWKDPPIFRTVNHLFLWTIYTMAMLVITRGYTLRLPRCQDVWYVWQEDLTFFSGLIS